MAKKLAAIALVLITATLSAAPKRRALQPPPLDTTTPAGWLAANAIVFSATESNGDVSDLARLGPLVGDATVVGLGDGTHGTHEYFVAKRRIIEYLVRNKDFDEVDFEGEYMAFKAIDAYVNGAPGDAKQLALSPTDAYYFFWETQELVDVIEWIRDYNLHRAPGARAVHVGGADIFGGVFLAKDVIAYLDGVDPAGAANARSSYSCVTSNASTTACLSSAAAMRDAIATHQDAYVAASSFAAFDEALHEASIIAGFLRNDRDHLMATNVLWFRDHRSASHKAIFWGHQEHAGKTGAQARPTGAFVIDVIGASYFAFGNATFDGTFLTNATSAPPPKVTSFLPLTADGYENSFHMAGAARVIIPLRGVALPAWLAAPHHLRSGDATLAYDRLETLKDKFDAVVYAEITTPNHALR